MSPPADDTWKTSVRVEPVDRDEHDMAAFGLAMVDDLVALLARCIKVRDQHAARIVALAAELDRVKAAHEEQIRALAHIHRVRSLECVELREEVGRLRRENAVQREQIRALAAQCGAVEDE